MEIELYYTKEGFDYLRSMKYDLEAKGEITGLDIMDRIQLKEIDLILNIKKIGDQRPKPTKSRLIPKRFLKRM